MPEEKEVIKAAIHWWEMRRPLEFTEEEHLENPKINTCSDAERELALAVAQLVLEERRLNS